MAADLVQQQQGPVQEAVKAGQVHCQLLSLTSQDGELCPGGLKEMDRRYTSTFTDQEDNKFR